MTEDPRITAYYKLVAAYDEWDRDLPTRSVDNDFIGTCLRVIGDAKNETYLFEHPEEDSE